MTTVTLLSAGDALDTGLMKNAFELNPPLRTIRTKSSLTHLMNV